MWKQLTEYARREFKLPEGWEFWQIAAVDNAPPGTRLTRLDGAVPLARKRDGSPNWRKIDKATKRQVFIDHDAFLRDAEARGICTKCWDDPRGVFISWNHKTGSKFKPCERCAAVAA